MLSFDLPKARMAAYLPFRPTSKGNDDGGMWGAMLSAADGGLPSDRRGTPAGEEEDEDDDEEPNPTWDREFVKSQSLKALKQEQKKQAKKPSSAPAAAVEK